MLLDVMNLHLNTGLHFLVASFTLHMSSVAVFFLFRLQVMQFPIEN